MWAVVLLKLVRFFFINTRWYRELLSRFRVVFERRKFSKLDKYPPVVGKLITILNKQHVQPDGNISRGRHSRQNSFCSRHRLELFLSSAKASARDHGPSICEAKARNSGSRCLVFSLAYYSLLSLSLSLCPSVSKLHFAICLSKPF